MEKLRYFTKREINSASFGCDDGYDRMEEEALIMFDRLREAVGFPLISTCFFRTKEYDIWLSRSGNSKHTLGTAADFACTDLKKRGKIIKEAIKLGFKGIGIHDEFIHVDIRDEDLVIWLY